MQCIHKLWRRSITAIAVGITATLTASCALVDPTGASAATSAELDPAAIPNQAWTSWVQQAGALCPQITAPLIAAQIEQESGWQPDAVSPLGAQGLSQFMPGTWPTYAEDDAGDGNISPFNPPDAIMAQGRYMCALVGRVQDSPDLAGQDVLTLALAAYNAGLDNVTKYAGVPPFPETQDYITEIPQLTAKYTAVAAATARTVAADGLGMAILHTAQTQLGLPYVWAGGTLTGPSGRGSDGRGPGFDCSGLVRYAVYQATGGAVTLPRVSRDQGRPGPHVAPVPAAQAQAGDLVAFTFDGRNGPASTDWDHIGIVSAIGPDGPTQMINAPETGRNIGYADLTMPFYTDAPHAYYRIQKTSTAP